jgi:hypothetical protein
VSPCDHREVTTSPASDSERRVTIAVVLVSAAATLYGLRTAPLTTLAAIAAFVVAVVALHKRLWKLPPDWLVLPVPFLAAGAMVGAIQIVRAATRSDRITVYLFNVDDHEKVYVGARQVLKADFLDTPSTQLPALSAQARIVVTAENDGSGYTWGLRLRQNCRSLYCERAGHAGVLGGGAFANDTTPGVTRRLVFNGRGQLLAASRVKVAGFPDEEGILHC